MNQQASDAVRRSRYGSRWRGGVWTLFLIGVFSVINLLMYAFGSSSYFLFTAYLPYSFGIVGIDYCMGWYGMPADGEFYTGSEHEGDVDEFEVVTGPE